MTRKLNKTIEILLFSILAIFPCAFEEINIQWTILLISGASFLLISYFLIKVNRFGRLGISVLFSILFLFIFNFSEKVNFIQLFNIHINTKWHIPLPTLILSISMLIYLIKILIEKKIEFFLNPFTKYFVFACAFLFLIMIFYFPFLSHHYQMKLNSNIQLINKIIKYLVIFLLISQCTKNEIQIKRLNIVFIASISLSLIFNILF